MPELQPIRGVLAVRGITQRRLAAHVGVHENYLSDVCRGVRPPSDRLARRISEALGVPVDELFRPADEPVLHEVSA